MFQFYEGDSPLHRANPSVKLIATVACLGALTLVFDPFVPALVLLVALLAAKWSARIPLKAMAAGLFPFLLLGLGFFWMQVAFPRGDVASLVPIARVGPLTLYREGLFVGAALGLRVLCYAAFGLLFVATTDPTRLVLSLMQQLRLSPRFGYSLLTAYRFFPMYQTELQHVRAAHQVRGVEEGEGLFGRVNRLRRYAIPLLAGAVRRAEAVAVAMESRGFDGRRQRTYYHRVPLRLSDLWIGLGYLAVVGACLWLGRALGLLKVWDGALYF